MSIEYTFNGQTHVMSLEELVSVNTCGQCSFTEYMRTPSIPHRDQLVETVIVGEQRPAKVKPGVRPTEDKAMSRWLRVHIEGVRGYSLCGKPMLNLVDLDTWRETHKRRQCMLCRISMAGRSL